MAIELRKIEDWPAPPETTDPYAAKLIDELLSMFVLQNAQHMDTFTARDALAYVKKSFLEHRDQPITVALARWLDESDRGWRK